MPALDPIGSVKCTTYMFDVNPYLHSQLLCELAVDHIAQAALLLLLTMAFYLPNECMQQAESLPWFSRHPLEVITKVPFQF